MTELKVILPDSLAREARKAGLLTQKAIGDLLRDAMRRRAARAFLSNAKAVAQAKIAPMSEAQIQAEVDAVRKSGRAPSPGIRTLSGSCRPSRSSSPPRNARSCRSSTR